MGELLLAAAILALVSGCYASVGRISYPIDLAPKTCTAFGARTGPWWKQTQYITICNDGSKLIFLPLGTPEANLLAQMAGPASAITDRIVIPVVP